METLRKAEMSGKTIRDQLAELSAKMAQEKNSIAFRSLVKEMSHLIAVEEMDRLLEACESASGQWCRWIPCTPECTPP
jgi:hypothetical protein